MTDVLMTIDQMTRPRLLTRTARLAANDYVRERHLKKVLGTDRPATVAAILRHLIDLEAELNQKRGQPDASYSVARHVDVLAAMISEARLMRRAIDP